MRTASLHRTVVELVEPQAGCVSRLALIAAGVSAAEIETLLAQGALVRTRPGLYLYGASVLNQQALWWTALLLGGAGARLAQRAALEAHQLLAPSASRVVVAHPRRSGHGRRTVTTLLPTERGRPATIVAIPTKRLAGAVKTGGVLADGPLRAIDDLAASGHTNELRRAWREADYRGLIRKEDVDAHLSVHTPGWQSVAELAQAHPLLAGDDVELLSRAERDLLEAIRRAGLPEPLVNALIDFGGRLLRPDFWFPSVRLVVEVDGQGHRLLARMREDQERDAHLAACGVGVLRVTDDEIATDLARCVGRIAARIAAGEQALAS